MNAALNAFSLAQDPHIIAVTSLMPPGAIYERRLCSVSSHKQNFERILSMNKLTERRQSL